VSTLTLLCIQSVLIAVFEETARSYLIRRTPGALGGDRGGLLIAIVLFSAIHAYSRGDMFWYQVATSGLLYCGVMWRTRDTTALACAHAAHNFVADVLTMFG
jgi:hypothetical protein